MPVLHFSFVQFVGLSSGNFCAVISPHPFSWPCTWLFLFNKKFTPLKSQMQAFFSLWLQILTFPAHVHNPNSNFNLTYNSLILQTFSLSIFIALYLWRFCCCCLFCISVLGTTHSCWSITIILPWHQLTPLEFWWSYLPYNTPLRWTPSHGLFMPMLVQWHSVA